MNNVGELAVIITDNNQEITIPNPLPSQYLVLTGYQLNFSSPTTAKAADGLVYVQIEDYLSFANVLDNNTGFTSIPLTYRLEGAAGVEQCFQTDGISRRYKINRKLEQSFKVKVFDSAKVEIADADIVRFVLYFSLSEVAVFTG